VLNLIKATDDNNQNDFAVQIRELLEKRDRDLTKKNRNLSVSSLLSNSIIVLGFIS